MAKKKTTKAKKKVTAKKTTKKKVAAKKTTKKKTTASKKTTKKKTTNTSASKKTTKKLYRLCRTRQLVCLPISSLALVSRDVVWSVTRPRLRLGVSRNWSATRIILDLSSPVQSRRRTGPANGVVVRVFNCGLV